MDDRHFEVIVAQVNTKRHWALESIRMLKMLRLAEKDGATIITLNEISRAQAYAIKNLPGWDIHWEINDHLKGGNWAGNAVAWKTKEWSCKKRWAQEVIIDYRRGKKSDPAMGKWVKKTIKQACVRLVSETLDYHGIMVQAFHYPTRFNSNDESRELAAAYTAEFARAHIDAMLPTVVGGDTNGCLPETPGLHLMMRDGPDVIKASGRYLKGKVLRFKRRLLSDHNGILVQIRFKITV